MTEERALPILPKATAVWLIENTSLTFEQIADFCGFHVLEIQNIADGDSTQHIQGMDPIAGGQLTKEEIDRCSLDSKAKLKLSFSNAAIFANKKKKNAKYTPKAMRENKPDAIYWLLKNCPEISDSQIIKLVGTTKTTIASLRDRTHWNIKNIRPRDPVLLGICKQSEINQLMSSFKLSPEKTDELPPEE